MNLCRPDNSKSCAACCGLYNVPDATRPSLVQKLAARTALFASTERSVNALIEYEAFVREVEKATPLDPAIHVCEFTGFLDEKKKAVGCLLHPLAPVNGGIDFRGLCYYGSVACKSFFCPAWEALDHSHREILAASIDDWHTYGLVVNDVGFVKAVFSLLEENLGEPLEAGVLFKTPASAILKEIMSWKTDWPFKGATRIRRSRYYFRDAPGCETDKTVPTTAAILESIRFTFDIQDEMDGAEEFIAQQAAKFAGAYRVII